MVELLIHRKEPGDLPNALAHVQTARQVAESHKAEVSGPTTRAATIVTLFEQVHGSDELEWLLATSWNQGLDFLRYILYI